MFVIGYAKGDRMAMVIHHPRLGGCEIVEKVGGITYHLAHILGFEDAKAIAKEFTYGKEGF